MGEFKCKNWSGQRLFVGVDLHKTKWVAGLPMEQPCNQR